MNSQKLLSIKKLVLNASIKAFWYTKGITIIFVYIHYILGKIR